MNQRTSVLPKRVLIERLRANGFHAHKNAVGWYLLLSRIKTHKCGTENCVRGEKPPELNGDMTIGVAP